MIDFVYSIFFALTFLSALMVVFSRHAIYSALYLIVTMVCIAGIFVMINADLAAVFQVLVYAGAIIMLFLFVIMLLNQGMEIERPIATRRIRQLGVVFFVLFLVQVFAVVMNATGDVQFDPSLAEKVTYREVGLILLTRYLYAFEMTSIMLLVAVVGAMQLAGRKSPSARELEGN